MCKKKINNNAIGFLSIIHYFFKNLFCTPLKINLGYSVILMHVNRTYYNLY